MWNSWRRCTRAPRATFTRCWTTWRSASGRGCAGGSSPRRRPGRIWMWPSGTPTPATTSTSMSTTTGRHGGCPPRRRRPGPQGAACGTTAIPAPCCTAAGWRRPWTTPGKGWRPSRSMSGAGSSWASCAATSATGRAPWRRWSGAWRWSPATTSSPPWPGRSGRAVAWRRWSSTGSTRRLTGGSRRGRTRMPTTSGGPSRASCATRRTWLPSRTCSAPPSGRPTPPIAPLPCPTGKGRCWAATSATRPPCPRCR